MKVTIFTLIFLTIPGAYACKQKVYDQVYKAIIIDAIKRDADDPITYIERNKSITVLRELCEGQKSSYERGDCGGRTQRKCTK